MVDVSEVKLKNFPYTMTYSLSKTGSTSVMNAVASAGIPCHRCYVGNVKKYHQADMPTITMVRDPIARYLSFLWEVYLHNPKSEHPKEQPQSVSMQQIEQSLAWFDDHYRPITGINIYSSQFVRSKGWHIYSIRGLVVRTDKISDVLEEALLEFLPPYFPDADYDNLTVEHRAKGEDRFGDKYKEYIDSTKFPKAFLQQVYTHKFMQHFFLKSERQKLLKKWKE